MIVVRTPLRISIGGGGTDLPSYYREYGGFVISAAIDKYVYISVNRTFFPGYLLKYSEIELAETLEAIRHPLIREALTKNNMTSNIEMISIADVPAGTGLGSSGAFLVGLLHALHAFKREHVNAEMLAREAIDIEMNHRLQEPVGKQDQYVAAYGGLICQEYRADDGVEIVPLRMSETATLELKRRIADALLCRHDAQCVELPSGPENQVGGGRSTNARRIAFRQAAWARDQDGFGGWKCRAFRLAHA